MSLNAKVVLLFGKLQTSICCKYFQNRLHHAKTNIKIGISEPKSTKKHQKKEINKNLLHSEIKKYNRSTSKINLIHTINVVSNI